MPPINLPLEKLICPICRGILIEPVTMPCSHALCLDCFNGTMEMANLTCPLCRKRVGGWLRTAKKTGKLIDADLWAYIQQNFAEYVDAKRLGEDDVIEDVLEGTAPPPVQLSAPGEIREEFEHNRALLEQELRDKQEAEAKASEELIRKMQEEEQARLAREEEDERFARELQQQLQQEVEEMQVEPASTAPAPAVQDDKENEGAASAPTTRGPLDAFLRPISNTQTERVNKSEERCDSITREILHFKPINAVPLTPPKTLPDGRVLQIQLVRATPVKNLLQLDTSPTSSSPQLSQQLSGLQVDRPKDESKPEVFPTASAFREFQGTGGELPTSSNSNSNPVAVRSISPDLFEDEEEFPIESIEDSIPPGLTQQEHQDFLLAQALQKSFDLEATNSSPGRTRNTSRSSIETRGKGKALLKGVVKKRPSKPPTSPLQQPTLKEAFKRAATRYGNQ